MINYSFIIDHLAIRVKDFFFFFHIKNALVQNQLGDGINKNVIKLPTYNHEFIIGHVLVYCVNIRLLIN